jgi:hypothetical protein
MKKSLILILLKVHFVGLSIYGNSIRGEVLNEKKQPLEFANIVLFNTEYSIPIASTFSDSIGQFEFQNVGIGNYFLEINYFGYSVDTLKNINVLDQVIILPTIIMRVKINLLEEISVTATKPIYERKADRIIFNVENSVYSQGIDALQALSKAPRVQIQNDEIKIAGRGIVAVLINDRLVHLSGEELSQYLKSIPSNEIQKIEVITNPPAKYDAQGTALINIVMKNDKKQGYNGSIMGSFIQAQYQGGNVGATFNYTKKKISFNTSITNQLNKGYREETHILKYYNQTWKDTTINPKKNNNISGRLGLNIDIDNKNTLGFNYSGDWNKVFWEKEHIITRIRDNNEILMQSIRNEANTNRNLYNHSFVTYYTLKMDTTGKKLDIGFDFFNSYRNINRNYTNETYNSLDSLLSYPIPQENTNGLQKSYIYTINADMEHPTNYGTWHYGSKFTFFNVRSDNKQSILQENNSYLIDTTRSNLFDYKEYNEAIYGSFNKVFEKIELQIGLRLEYTQLIGKLVNSGEVNKQSYIRPFPSLMLQYTINENHQLNFSSNSRIDRPAFFQLNPFRFYYTQYNYAEGNPNLKPLISYNFSLDYVLKENYNFSIYYNYSLNGAFQVRYVNADDTINYAFWESEGRKTHDFGTYNEFNFSINDKWNINTYIDAYLDFLKSPYLFNAKKLTFWGMHLGIDNDFTFDRQGRFTGNLNFLFMPPKRNNGELTMRSYYQLDFGLKAKLLKSKQLILTLNANNVFRSKNTNGYTLTPTGEYFSFTNFYNDRVFSFSFMYKFGNSNLKTKNKKTENTDINRAK